MKRSQINAVYRQAKACFEANGWTLPPNPKWDITDFELGEFEKKGLVLINLAEEKEYCEKADYIANNPIKEGFAEKEAYPWWWDELEHSRGKRAGESSGKEHRLETGATSSIPQAHRLETGATHDRLYACVFIKHTNACGVGIAQDPIEAYRDACAGS